MSSLSDKLDSKALARLAQRTPEPVLRAMAAGPMRSVVVAEVFRRMPAQMKPAAAPPACVIRWKVGEGERVETWFCVFQEGRCRTTKQPPEGTARTTLEIGTLDFLRLATGAELPMAMFQDGRIRISGDLFFAAQLQGMFEIPG